MSLTLRAEMFWRSDPAVAAARKMPGWAEFHRECGRAYLFFDHIEKAGKGSNYTALAFTLTGRDRSTHTTVATGEAKTPIIAIADAYRRAVDAGLRVPAAEPWLSLLVNPAEPLPAPPPVVEPDIDIDDILGADDFEGILG